MRSFSPSSFPPDASTHQTFFQRYGPGCIIAAGFFGAGSIFILSAAGISFGYGLLWAVLLSGAIGVKAQSLSIRVGIWRKPLMVLLRERAGRPMSVLLAVYLCIIATLWVLELRAADGMALSLLLGGGISWEWLNYAVGGLAILFVAANIYSRFEKFITVFLFLTVLCFIAVACLRPPPLLPLIEGLVPYLSAEFATTEYGVLVVCILGTTVLWPNIFLQSTLVRTKGWTTAADYRLALRDTVLGFAIGIAGSAAILISSATIIRPMGIAKLESFITPALVLSESVGAIGGVLFLAGLFMAAFNSSIVITITLVNILNQALDRPATFGDRRFLITFAVISIIGSLFPLVARATGMTIVDAIILFPGVNGALGLPLVIVLLFAFKPRRPTGRHRTRTDQASDLTDIAIVVLTVFIGLRSITNLARHLF